MSNNPVSRKDRGIPRGGVKHRMREFLSNEADSVERRPAAYMKGLPLKPSGMSSTTALVAQSGINFSGFDQIPTEWKDGEPIAFKPVEDRSLTERQHLKMWGQRSLLRGYNPFSQSVTKRQTSRSKVTRIDPDAPIKQRPVPGKELKLTRKKK